MATTFGFSCRQGPHHEAQKSTIVTFPKQSFSAITLPSGFGAEKSVLHLAGAAAGACICPGDATAPGFLISANLVLIAFPGFVFFKSSSKLL